MWAYFLCLKTYETKGYFEYKIFSKMKISLRKNEDFSPKMKVFLQKNDIGIF